MRRLCRRGHCEEGMDQSKAWRYVRTMTKQKVRARQLHSRKHDVVRVIEDALSASRRGCSRVTMLVLSAQNRRRRLQTHDYAVCGRASGDVGNLGKTPDVLMTKTLKMGKCSWNMTLGSQSFCSSVCNHNIVGTPYIP